MSAINVAEGQKQSQILASEGRKSEQINIATGIYKKLKFDTPLFALTFLL